MKFLKQLTAVTVKMGAFLDSTDGNTQETGLTINRADIRISKNGGAFAQKNNATAATHDEKGWYGVLLSITDTNTLGILDINIHVAGALEVWENCMVLSANVWDSLFGSDKLDVNVEQLGGVAQSLIDLKDFADEGYDPVINKVEGVKTVDVNTDMRGTDNAALAAVCTEGRLSELAAANLPSNVDALIAALILVKAKTDNLPDGILKNTALNNFEFLMVSDSDHLTGQTGLTVTCQRSIDGGAFGDCNTVTATEVALGIYKVNLAASDLNGDVITVKFTAADADTRFVTIITQS